MPAPGKPSTEAATTGAAGADAGADAFASGAGAAGAGVPAPFAADAAPELSGTASPSATRTAMGAFTATPSVPSATSKRPTLPSSTASNSMVALSVLDLGQYVRRLLTSSPSFTNHFASLPSSIVGERAGIRISIAMASETPSSFQPLDLGVHQNVGIELGGIRLWRLLGKFGRLGHDRPDLLIDAFEGIIVQQASR